MPFSGGDGCGVSYMVACITSFICFAGGKLQNVFARPVRHEAKHEAVIVFRCADEIEDCCSLFLRYQFAVQPESCRYRAGTDREIFDRN
jgi:hypothetical protein